MVFSNSSHFSTVKITAHSASMKEWGLKIQIIRDSYLPSDKKNGEMLAAQIVVIETYKAYMTHSDLIKDQLTQGPTALMSQTFS